MGEDEKKALPASILFHYVKSALFRVIHVDGALGSVTPKGLIHMALYSERAAIPRVVERDVGPTGIVGEPRVIEGRDGIVREVDADLMMSRDVAVEIRDWLDSRIKDLDSMISQSDGEATPDA